MAETSTTKDAGNGRPQAADRGVPTTPSSRPAHVDSNRHWSPAVDATLLARLAARAAVAAPAETIPVEAPFTGEMLGEVPKGRPADVAAAAAAAAAAQAAWARRPVSDRARILLRFHDLLFTRAQEALDLIQLEGGKARRHALEEVLDVAIQARYYAHVAGKLLGPRRVQTVLPVLTKAWEQHAPCGVVGIIAPWNYPLVLTAGDAIPALAAGNGVVLKPDAETPFIALWMAELLEEAGLPHDLLKVVTGRGGELGGPLVEAVDFVMFTGSTAVGSSIAAQAASRLKGSSVELSGKNPLLVLPDAALDAAVRGAVRGICASTGQLCLSIERVYVHDAIYDAFVPRLAKALGSVRLGAGLDFAADMGSLIDADHLEKVAGRVDEAVAKGADVLAGGHARPDVGPHFYEATLLAGVTEEMTVHREEAFGPVAAVYRCGSVDEMIAKANDSDYGLNASVWTRDSRAARDVAGRLQCGTVNINEAYAAAWASMGPMGGFKTSGLGRRHGAPGLFKYTEAQTVAAQRLIAIDTPPFLTHERYAAVLTTVVRALKRLPGYK